MSDPEIVVTENGPYQVNADLPITPRRVAASERGEPLTSIIEPALPHDTPTWICRCGHSQNKPFCDGSHKRVGFVGTETASTKPFSEARRSYEGIGLTVHRVGALCAHSSYCANQVTDWHKLLPDTGSTNVLAEVISMIEHCPSGALVMELGGEIVEPSLPRSISPVEDGPYWVFGRVTVHSGDGTPYEVRNRVALCRCGQSKNKPFCDGTHAKIGFEAPNPTPVVEEELPPPQMAPVYRRVAVAVHDGTTEETYAVAAMIARAAGAEVSLVHVGSQDPASERVLSDAAAQAHVAGIPTDRVATMLRLELPTAALHAAALDVDAGLMIVGRGGSHLARLTRQVSMGSPCDVLVVARRGDDRPSAYRRIVIATDGSKTADRAARRGYDLARALDATVDL
ncbi:MAG: hypothetical protein EHM57_05260, partial [Actinobacteria bacterium]